MCHYPTDVERVLSAFDLLYLLRADLHTVVHLNQADSF